MSSELKYRGAFSQGRIKKILQTDEEVGRVAQGSLVVLSKAVEKFLETLVHAAVEEMPAESKILSAQHLKQCILNEKNDDMLDYLKDIANKIIVEESKDGEGKKRKRPVSKSSVNTRPKKTIKKEVPPMKMETVSATSFPDAPVSVSAKPENSDDDWNFDDESVPGMNADEEAAFFGDDDSATGTNTASVMGQGMVDSKDDEDSDEYD